MLKAWRIPGGLPGFCLCRKPDESGPSVGKGMVQPLADELAIESDASRQSFPHPILCGLLLEDGIHRGSSHFKQSDQENPPWEGPEVVFQLVPDPVRLTTKISHHSKFYENFISICKLLRKITLKDKTVPLPFRNMGMIKVKLCFPSQSIPT